MNVSVCPTYGREKKKKIFGISVFKASWVGICTTWRSLTTEKRRHNFYVYQQPPSFLHNLTLAWLVSPYALEVGGIFTFTWDTQYSFVFGTGVVKPGVTFRATGLKPCDPTNSNTVNFTFSNNTPSFNQPAVGGPSGSLTIHDEFNVPPNKFAVGVGMSGKGIYVVNAEPNLTHLFTPTPKYFVAAADSSVTEGEVMDITTITKFEELKFPRN